MGLNGIESDAKEVIDNEAWMKEPGWDGWEKRERHNALARKLGPHGPDAWISCIGQLYLSYDGDSICLDFPTPRGALNVAMEIEEQIKDEN